jgi:hypothetical protein
MIHTTFAVLNNLLNGIDITTFNPTKPAIVAGMVALLVAVLLYQQPSRLRTPKLRGPPSSSWLFGATQEIFDSSDLGILYGNWEKKYGPVYEIPSSLRSKMLLLGDSKGVGHFFAKDTSTYHQPEVRKIMNRQFVSRLTPPVSKFYN